MTEQPNTAAGRDFLRDFEAWMGADQTPALRDRILAIETEMYDRASNEGYHRGIADCKEHDPAHNEARQQGGSGLREALVRIRDEAYDTNDECRYCDGDIEEGHPEDCPTTIALSALVRLAALPPSAPEEPTPEQLAEGMLRLRSRNDPPSAPPALDVER